MPHDKYLMRTECCLTYLEWSWRRSPERLSERRGFKQRPRKTRRSKRDKGGGMMKAEERAKHAHC